MPIKDGDKVFFKIQNGTVRTGKYDAKTKMVMLAGGKKAKPPKKALFHTRASAMKNAFMGATNPNPELGAAPRKKAVPKGSHRMPDGSIMKDKDMKGSKNKKEKATPKKTPTKEMSRADVDKLFNNLNNYDKALKLIKADAKKGDIDTHLRIDIAKKGSKLRRTFLWDGKNIYRQGLFGKEGGILGKAKNMKWLYGWYLGTYNKFNIPDVILKDENKNLQQGLTLNKEGVSQLR